MKVIAKFYVDYGKMGEVMGQFVTTKEAIKKIIGQTVFFDDILGKHSNVEIKIKQSHFKVVSEDQEFINKYLEIFGSTASGYSPFDFLDEEDYEDE